MTLRMQVESPEGNQLIECHAATKQGSKSESQSCQMFILCIKFKMCLLCFMLILISYFSKMISTLWTIWHLCVDFGPREDVM